VTGVFSGLAVREIPVALAREVAEREHYMHRKPQVRHSFGLYTEQILDETGLYPEPALVGVCVFGTPASRELQTGVCPSDPSLVLELNRLWVDDRMPRNTESWFVSRCLARLPPRIVVSYADTSRGHLGYVYRALNFRYAGWTDMERKTARLDYLPADPRVHTRDAYRNGYVRKVRRVPKVKYWTVTGNRAECRRLTGLCAWPSLDWGLLPPPVEHRQHRVLRGDPLVPTLVDSAANMNPRGEPVPVVGDLLADLDCTTTQTAPGHAACLANAYILHDSNCTL